MYNQVTTCLSFLFALHITVCYCERRSQSKLPLIESDLSRGNKISTRVNSCIFGNQTYDINEKWKPNLGSSIGTLYCVRCECVEVNRKNHRTVTRVKCKNIKHDCPKPTCDDAVLLPGRCCKTCPSDDSPDFEDELTGRSIKRQGHEGKRIYAMVGKIHKVALNSESTSSLVTSSSSLLDPSASHSATADAAASSSASVSTTSVSLEHKDTLVSDRDSDHQNNDISSSQKCYYEGEIFEDGSQWKAQHQECQMCSCLKGRIKCHDMVCPELSCSHSISVPGECCKTCPGENVSISSNSSLSESRGDCYFEADKKWHMAGTKWHPYLPSFGFDRCSLCTCLPNSLSIECKRSVTCPPLTCSESEAYRENPMDCCKRCPAIAVSRSMSPDQLADQRATSSGLTKTPHELLQSGGCKMGGRVFPNGDEWHPSVPPFGEVKCVNCHCKDGRYRCKRTRCPRLSCARKVIPNDQCCPRCA